jgi:hypothetical protein
MIKIIKNEQRYHYENDWLSTYWHFSFDHYYDPANMGFGASRESWHPSCRARETT